MNSNEKRDKATEMEKQSHGYLWKACLWALGLGACFSGVLDNYAKSSNFSLGARVLRTSADEEDKNK